MSKELKPCPFCGTEPNEDPHPVAVACYHSVDGWSVLCEECMTEGSTFENKEDAISAWNTRTSHPLPTEEEVARVIVRAKGAPVTASDEMWPGAVAHYRQRCAEDPSFADERGLVPDGFRAAKDILSMLRREE